MLAVAAAPCAGLSQSVRGGVEQQRQLVDRIQEEQAQNGPYSLGLLAPLRALIVLYQEGGDEGLAIAAIERALQVLRANYGLRTLDQAPLIQQWIQLEEMRGNVPDAWNLEKQLLTLAAGHPDDLRTVSIFREIGDNRMELLRRYVAGEFVPQVLLGCFYKQEEYRHGELGSCDSGSRGVAIQSLLVEAQKNYLAAIAVMRRLELYSSDELRALETQLLRSSYGYGRHEVGRQSLLRLMEYDEASSAPWLKRIETFVQIADWDLLFAPNWAGLEEYDQAYEQLKQQGAAPESIEKIFSPKMPVVLPTFWPNPLVSEETEESTGYIDVAFEVTKYGRSRRVEILDTTTNASGAAKDNLVALIRRSRFRPRVTDGEFARSAPVAVRYYLNE